MYVGLACEGVKLIDGLSLVSNLRIIPADTVLLAEGWDLYRSRPDKEWSLTDCISIVLMQKERIEEVFTSDHHFEQAGFGKLL
jgi:predicted nucleic acid-binding protein